MEMLRFPHFSKNLIFDMQQRLILVPSEEILERSDLRSRTLHFSCSILNFKEAGAFHWKTSRQPSIEVVIKKFTKTF